MLRCLPGWRADSRTSASSSARRSANDCKTSRFDRHARLVYACDGTSYLPTPDMAWSSFSHVSGTTSSLKDKATVLDLANGKCGHSKAEG